MSIVPFLLWAALGLEDSRSAAGDPAAAIFVADRVGDGEGAPPAASLGSLVLMTDLDEADPYWPVVERLREAKNPVAVLSYEPGRIEGVELELRRVLPEFAIVVTRPERIDVNLHLDLLELSSRLDDDPFVDVAFGYVTGASPVETLAFVDRFLAVAKKRNALPKSILEFGPAQNARTSQSGPRQHAVAKGWKQSDLYHGPLEDLLDGKRPLAGYGVLRAGGHGMPDGVVDGLKGADLRSRRLDLSPAIYFSGPCYCGVTGPYFEMQSGAVHRKLVRPEESFALAAIASGVTALFAGLDPDRGETTSQEMEHLWIEGGALGHAVKGTYDGCVLALRRPTFELYRYADGKGRPYRDLAEQMIGAAAGRALFGDPTLVPFAAAAKPPFPVKQKGRRDGFELVWSADEAPTSYWMANDVFRCDGGWTHRIQFAHELPPDQIRAIRSFEVAELKAKRGPLEGRFATAMVERWGGRAYVHVYVVFPVDGDERAFFANREFVARFAFRTK